MTVGERIRAARKAQGLTQKQLGEKCGIAEPTIRRYELGKLNPKPDTLKKIAKALGVLWLSLGDYDLGTSYPDQLCKEWLQANGITFISPHVLNDTVGCMIFFPDSNEPFFLTQEQFEALPGEIIDIAKHHIVWTSEYNMEGF